MAARPRRAIVQFQGVKQPCRRNPETAEFDPKAPAAGKPLSKSWCKSIQ